MGGVERVAYLLSQYIKASIYYSIPKKQPDDFSLLSSHCFDIHHLSLSPLKFKYLISSVRRFVSDLYNCSFLIVHLPSLEAL